MLFFLTFRKMLTYMKCKRSELISHVETNCRHRAGERHTYTIAEASTQWSHLNWNGVLGRGRGRPQRMPSRASEWLLLVPSNPERSPPSLYPSRSSPSASQRSGIRRDKLFSALIAMGHDGFVSWDKEVGQGAGTDMWMGMELRSMWGMQQGHAGPSQRAAGS